MRSPEQQIIRDYLGRKYWYYLAGAIIHLACAYATGWTNHVSLIGAIGGSAFILMFELMRGGNATARTLLSLPVTPSQLARAWRFVALTLPIILYFVVLLVGSLLSLKMGGNLVNIERFIILAVTQTGMIGTAFFALTGIPAQPSQGVGFAQGLRNAFFGMLWGFSIPALMFAVSLTPPNFAAITPGHALAGIFLVSATIAAWFRAEALVMRRASRPGSTLARVAEKPGSSARAMPWRGFGGMPYFFRRFGLANTVIFAFMVCISWFGMDIFLKLSSGSGTGGVSTDIRDTQLGMFIPMIGLIAMLQLIPSLRVIRTMPRRLSTVTSCLVFWPLALTSALGLAAYLMHMRLYRVEFDMAAYLNSLVAGSLILLGIPLVLRFGLKVSTMVPIILLISVSQGLNLLVRDVFKVDLLVHWPYLLALILITICAVWCLTYMSLRSAYPWRGNLLKLPGMGQKM
ncbi:MAG: hypothetical protein ACR2RV_06830 [Verrucomicrobiales bacterium]